MKGIPMKPVKLLLFLSVLGLLLTVAPLRAQQVDWQADATVASDYVFRGVSRSDSDPAVQGNLDLLWGDWFAGVFASTLGGNGPFGRDVEGEVHAGYFGFAETFDYGLTLKYDSFHGDGGSDGYFEVSGSVSRDFGLAYLTGGVAYAPDDREFGGGESFYAYTEADIPLTFPDFPPLTLNTGLGYEDFEGGLEKWNWHAGLFLEISRFEMGVKYTDTDLGNVRGADAKVLGTVRVYF